MFSGPNEELIEHYQIADYERKEAKKALMKEAKEVRRMPAKERNKHYVKVKQERGIKAANKLVLEVRRQNEVGMSM